MLQTTKQLSGIKEVMRAFEVETLDDLQAAFEMGGYEAALSIGIDAEGNEIGIVASLEEASVVTPYPCDKAAIITACTMLEESVYQVLLESGTGGCPACADQDIITQLGDVESDGFYAAADALLTQWESAGKTNETPINPHCRLCFGRGMRLWS